MHDIQKKHKIVVQGVPSVKLQKEMADEEKKRIAKQVRIDSVIYSSQHLYHYNTWSFVRLGTCDVNANTEMVIGVLLFVYMSYMY